MRAFFVLIAAFTLSACASHGRPITDEQVSAIREGVTTKQDLLASFGRPVVTSKSSDGTEIIGWGYAKVGFAGSSYTNQSITVTLNPDGTVKSYTTSATGDQRR
ncbi:hypothetical protein [Stutzerimonas stutzeri]|uniref:hypothetical protein n=1 Tax=Stutzerimonas stutzeri TaxID=316 RepID=UPI003721FEF5